MFTKFKRPESATRFVLPLVALLLASDPAWRASAEIFLKNSRITGAVAIDGYRNQLRLDRVSFGVRRGALEPPDDERLSIGVGELVPLTLAKPFDPSSAQWAQHAVSGDSVGSVEIRLTRSIDDRSTPVAVALIVLDRVFVLNYAVSATNDERPVEEMTLGYGRISYQNLLPNEQGGFEASRQIGWDLANGAPWEHETVLTAPDGTGHENMPPIAMPDTFRILEDTLEAILTVAANDRDADDDPLTLATITNDTLPDGFTIKKASNNRDILFTPPADFFGTVVFHYRVSDGTDESEPARVEVEIANVNDAPRLGKDSFESAGQALPLVPEDLLKNDEDIEGDDLSLIAVQSPTRAGGTVTLNDGRIVYTPPPGFTGTDSFDYTVTDGTDESSQTASIEVTGTLIQRVVRITLLDRTVAVIEFMGQPGQSYRVEMTEQLQAKQRRWEPLAVVQADNDGRFEYRDNATTPQRFYRSAFLPRGE